tara:strand:- start:122 stop:256 length:135 start_codon:yes stop_codon:yes gene_type:complete
VPLRIKPERPEIRQNPFESSVSEVRAVLKDDKSRIEFIDKAGNL